MTKEFHRPVWDRGEPIDAAMLAFTVGDDWLQDRRLIEHDIRGSLAHVDGLLRIGLIEARDHASIRDGLTRLLESHRRGEWTVEASDEDVHSAVERRLTELVGDAGKRLHTARSRNEQVAVDVRLWLRDASARVGSELAALRAALVRIQDRSGQLPLPGYTHLRRAMPSTIDAWAAAHERALGIDAEELTHASRRWSECPLGSGAGYGVPLELAREQVAQALGFDGAEQPVTLTQHSRGRAELAYVTALETIALDVGKLANDLWLFSTEEFGFVRLAPEMTTGSSLMPHKRNPDVLELARAHCRQVAADRAALLDVIRDLPSGYHRDFQLIKPPLFRAHDRMHAMLPVLTHVLDGLEFDESKLRAACADPKLRSTERALDKVQGGATFRDAYREEANR